MVTPSSPVKPGADTDASGATPPAVPNIATATWTGDDSSSEEGSAVVVKSRSMMGLPTPAPSGAGPPIWNYVWVVVMGSGALMDILATILPPYVESVIADAQLENKGVLTEPLFSASFETFVNFLDHHEVTITFIFSAMWFVEAFINAGERKEKILYEEEKKVIMSEGKEGDIDKANRSANFAYVQTIILQLLLLPVGFYFLVYYALDHASHGEEVGDLDKVSDKYVLKVQDLDDGVHYETFSASSKLTLLFAILQHFWLQLSGTTARVAKSEIDSLIRSTGPRLARKLVGKAIRNPRKFRRRLANFLNVVRWVKYLVPVIATGNKLRENISDMLKKWRQRRQAREVQRVRQILWKEKTKEVKEVDAAKMIQSAYRSFYTRKATKALMALRGNKQYFAALKVQKIFRRRLAEAKARLEKKEQELKQLQKRHGRDSDKLSKDEKKRLYELQDELGEETRQLINRKLLLRPNTKFAVIWKILFVCCVLIEITQKAVIPAIQKYKAKKSDDDMTMQQYVAITFVPTPASKRAECQIKRKKNRGGGGGTAAAKAKAAVKDAISAEAPPSEEELANLPWYCRQPVAAIQEGFSDAIALAVVPAPVTEWSQCQEKPKNPKNVLGRVLRNNRNKSESKKWYCEDPYSWMHGIYRQIVDFILEEFSILVSVVCFLDVPITFFTGELDPDNGTLVPKPFFKRWILPGIVLQLLVNPELETVSQWTGYFLDNLLEMGPIRVFRWTVSLIFPLVFLIVNILTKFVWLPLVQFENNFRQVDDSWVKDV